MGVVLVISSYLFLVTCHSSLLKARDFWVQVVETYWYEQLSHAVLMWLLQNRARCDLVHVHEWGGVFADVVTATAFRQLKPGVD